MGFGYNKAMTLEWIDADWLLSPGQPPQQEGAVGVDKTSGRIVGTQARSERTEYKDASGAYFLTPGLINAHTHLELYRPEPISKQSDDSMADWLLNVIEFSRNLTPAERLQNCLKSITEMIRTGTTCVNDITSTGASLEALSQVGMRGIASPEFFYPAHSDNPDVEAIVERFWTFKKRFAGHPLLAVGISPHSPYNVTPQAWSKVLSQIQPEVVHSHLAETQEEMAWFQQGCSVLDKVHETVLGRNFGPIKSGVTPLKGIAALLSSRHIMAHGVFLSDEDVKILVQSQVSLVHCPRSNLLLSGKTITAFKQWHQMGLVIGIGTDSRLSCPSLDLREEGRVARQQHHLSAKETFELMTQGSAQAIHQENNLGAIAPDFKADLVLWWSPETDIENPYETWLSPETQPIMVWINGRIVLERCL